MQAAELKDFRLVGGTALSLYLGHRLSVDIDLFTDAPYRSIDFDCIEQYLLKQYKYVQGDFGGNPGMGKSYLVGTDRNNAIKLDLYYAMDPFFQDYVIHDDVRMATVEEIIAMKVDVILRGGRKKDYWDLHQLLENYTIDQMIDLHQKRFEWTHDREKILKNFRNFSDADLDFDPICLKAKEWIFIKEDFEDALKTYF
ncbi:nucleotidyl transferase AbiEii/AbiGii toxin family protein [Pedobacter sp. N23S346]|uniref:nucleotidyl transferase AbiEii/AbiGii toxin family protein n=1 Tax=Pedobacter sp. N23S346 TaxID=3402750 RepID=UPI003ABE0D35